MTTFGKYQVVERIGQGGFGQVFRGYDPVLKRYVAIKTCTLRQPDTRARFVREAEIAANLRHPNIVTVYDFGEHDGEPYLVQEFLSGADLEDRMRAGGPIDLRTKVEWLVQIAEGLQFAHAHGVIHRDVKPGNVRITDDGRVRIMDFGIAKLMESEQQLTQTGYSVGTSGYLAPEHLAGLELDHRADIFSLGVLAYELIGGRRPFEAESLPAVFYRIAHEEPAPLSGLAPDCPAWLVSSVERCLRKNRNDRYAHLGLLVDELRAGLARGGTPGPPAAVSSAPVAAATGPATAAAASPAPPADGVAAARRSRLPLYGGLAAAALAVAVFGILNLARWTEGARRGADRLPVPESPAVATDASAPDPLTAIGRPADGTAEAAATGPGGGAGAADRDARTASGGAAGAGSRGTMSSPPSASPAPAGRVPAATPPAGPAVAARRVILLLAGSAPVGLATAEATLIEELAAAGLDVLDAAGLGPARAQAETLAGGTDANRAAALGLAHGAAWVVLGSLEVDAVPSVGQFYTGSATLTLRVYDAVAGRLAATERHAVGSGDVPGRLEVTPRAAADEAAAAVARAGGLAVARRIR
jgi:predicted Ser/Thr protein kinase